MKKFGQLGAIAVVVAALLWSVDGLLRIHLQESLRAPVIVFWEHLFGAILLLPIALASAKSFKQLTRKQWFSITGVAFLSGAIGTILYTAALGRTMFIPFSVVVLLQQLNPIFAISASAVLLREPLTKRFALLSLVAIAAAYFLWLPGGHVNLSTGNGTLMGGLMAIGAAAAWGTSTAFSKYALKGTSTLHITSLRFAITPFFALLFVFFTGDKHLPMLTGDQFKYLLAITFSTGMVALLIYYWGLKRVLASRSAILELAWPASAVLIGWIWQHQGLSWSQAIASIVMVAAIYYVAQEDKDTETALAGKTKKSKPSRKAVAKATA
ncbi:MAG TPA: DMT family transporter [Candidatus Saccharimonadales bacterium]|nr:DMT family transporter [Candidatus Saccharimonadales bacterium]